MPELSNLYPYVVPKSWCDHAGWDNLVSWEVRDDVHVVLVLDQRGMVQNFRPQDMEGAKLDQGAAFDLAANNLARAWMNEEFFMGFANLADGIDIGCCQGSWMAPSGGIVLGNFHAMLAEHFGVREFAAVAVDQQTLYAFPVNDRTLYSLSLRRLIENGFEGASKKISQSWILLDGGWPKAFPGRSSF